MRTAWSACAATSKCQLGASSVDIDSNFTAISQIATDDEFGDFSDDRLFNPTFDRSSAVVGIISLLKDVLARGRSAGDDDGLLLETIVDVSESLHDDRAEFTEAELAEHDDVIEAVEEFGLEELADVAHDAVLEIVP